MMDVDLTKQLEEARLLGEKLKKQIQETPVAKNPVIPKLVEEDEKTLHANTAVEAVLQDLEYFSDEDEDSAPTYLDLLAELNRITDPHQNVPEDETAHDRALRWARHTTQSRLRVRNSRAFRSTARSLDVSHVLKGELPPLSIISRLG
mmetsp:Transcript_25134/g.31541  ORF Transcript_25134/g.31541 Transcript_25134/m.31541 type:complete len:148 (+) Transcript_25134:27-470(+)